MKRGTHAAPFLLAIPSSPCVITRTRNKIFSPYHTNTK